MTRVRLVSVCFLMLALSTGCGRGEHKASPDTAPVIAATDLALHEVTTATEPETAELSGSVKAAVSALVAARTPGTVLRMNVREGNRVAAGQTLALLDAGEIAASSAAAAATAEEAAQALNEAKARRQLADSTYHRFENLYAEQAVTRQEFENRQNERELAVRGVARAEARLRQARESSRAAAKLAGYARITAPLAGMVTSRKVDQGSTVFPGQPLLTIEREGSYRLELNVPESMAPEVRKGALVRVWLDGLAAGEKARISEITPEADPGSRTFIAKAPVSLPGVRTGMFGRGVVELGKRSPVMWLPRKAVIEQGGLTSVWVLGADKRISLRLIKAGRTLYDRVEILSGLQAGERVVAGGLEKIREGARVK